MRLKAFTLDRGVLRGIKSCEKAAGDHNVVLGPRVGIDCFSICDYETRAAAALRGVRRR
jgi:hypothetical protein